MMPSWHTWQHFAEIIGFYHNLGSFPDTKLSSFQLASKASHRLGIICRAKSFLGTTELLTTYKAFIHSLIEYWSPLWGGAPASRLSRIHPVETKAFRIIGISCGEAEFEPLTLSLQVGQWSFCLLPSPLRSHPTPLILSVCD